MKIPVRVSSVVRGFVTSGAPAAGAIFFARALAVQPNADNVPAQSADSLNITGSTAGITPQPFGGKRVAGRLPCVGVCEPDIWLWEDPIG